MSGKVIHAPRLMPDENAASYWGRVFRINAVPAVPAQETAFSLRMRQQMRGDRERAPELASVIGTVADLPLTTVVRSHTLVPFRGAALAVVNGDWCDNSYRSRDLRQSAMHCGPCLRALCPMCAREDIDYWGFSYWRRTHQIASVTWCQKHGCPLFRTREIASWQTMPHEVMVDPRPEDAEVTAHSMGNPVLRRYAEICSELLQRPRPLSTAQMVCALSKRARSHGLAVNPMDHGRRLSDLAAERVTGPWQALFWKALSAKPAGEHLPTLDGVLSRLRAAVSAQGYALAMALLYDSVDHALWDIDQALPPVESLAAAIDAEAARPVRNELPRTPEEDARRRERFRQAATLMLSGLPLELATRRTGWGSEAFERMFVRCLVTQPAHETVAASREPISSYR